MKDLASLLPLVAVLGLAWLILIRPVRRQRQAQASVQARLAVGDSVMTTSGIYGRVSSMDGERVGLEVASGVTVQFARRAVLSIEDSAPPATNEER